MKYKYLINTNLLNELTSNYVHIALPAFSKAIAGKVEILCTLSVPMKLTGLLLSKHAYNCAASSLYSNTVSAE